VGEKGNTEFANTLQFEHLNLHGP